VRKYGGYIGELNVTGPRGAGRSLVARLRIPSDRLNSVVEELKRLGRVEQETQRGEEVTQQYVDLTARLTNARNTEQRLLEILRERTGKISEVLAVEREIARVREEIERTDAQLKNLVKQVQFATVELQVREEYKTPLEVTPRGAGTRLRNATIEGYRSLVETVLGLVLFLLRSGPVLLFWAFILYWPVRFVWRRIRTRRSAKETKTAA
jgi:hypothetical protein